MVSGCTEYAHFGGVKVQLKVHTYALMGRGIYLDTVNKSSPDNQLTHFVLIFYE